MGSGADTVTTWRNVGLTRGIPLPLAGSSSGVYTVRAVNALGHSSAAELLYVGRAIETMTPTDAYPVNVTASGRRVTATFLPDLSIDEDHIAVRLLPAEGWDYRDEQVIGKGSDAWSFDNVPNGRYRVIISGLQGRAATRRCCSASSCP